MNTSEQTNELNGALSKAQSEMKDPDKSREVKSGSYNFKYADLSDVLNAARPILSKNGLSVMQVTRIDDGSVVLVTRLGHSSGQWVECEYPVSDSNAKHQTMGAAVTYARRYSLSSLIGLSSVEDTDSQGTQGAHQGEAYTRLSSQRAKELINFDFMIEEINSATHSKLDALEKQYTQKLGFLPGSWVSSFVDKIEGRREELDKIDLAEIDNE